MSKKTPGQELLLNKNVVPIITPLLVSVPQAAAILNTTRWAVRNLIWTHKVPTIHLGKANLIPVRALEEFVETQTRAARLRLEMPDLEPKVAPQAALRLVARQEVRQ